MIGQAPERVYQCPQGAHLIALPWVHSTGTFRPWEGLMAVRHGLIPPAILCQLPVLLLNEFLQLCSYLSPVRHHELEMYSAAHLLG